MVVKLFKSKPCKLRILIKRESGNIIVENIVNTLITSFVCSDILLEKVSLVEFIVSWYDWTNSISWLISSYTILSYFMSSLSSSICVW